MTCSCRIKVTRVYAVLKCYDFMSHSSEPKKEPKKGRSSALPLRGKRLRFMGFNRFEQPGIAFILHPKRLTP